MLPPAPSCSLTVRGEAGSVDCARFAWQTRDARHALDPHLPCPDSVGNEPRPPHNSSTSTPQCSPAPVAAVTRAGGAAARCCAAGGGQHAVRSTPAQLPHRVALLATTTPGERAAGPHQRRGVGVENRHVAVWDPGPSAQALARPPLRYNHVKTPINNG